MDYLFKSYFLFLVIINSLNLLSLINKVEGHGRLIDPPSRSSAWRFGFKTPINYNDNELFCGGFNVHYNVNKGKCGVCGDPFNGKRNNELPNGKYAQNLAITRTYREGNVIDIKVQLTANHKGFFVFKVCPAFSDSEEVTQECLDRFPLHIINSMDSNKYIVPTDRTQIFDIKAKLPNALTCNRCVLQWTYTSANNWGKCENGSSQVGCGPQETFRGCGDVMITSHDLNAQITHHFSAKVKNTIRFEPLDKTYTQTSAIKSSFIPTVSYSKPYQFSTQTNTKMRPTLKPTLKPNINKVKHLNACRSHGLWKGTPNMDQWCQVNCAANYCPSSHCICTSNI